MFKKWEIPKIKCIKNSVFWVQCLWCLANKANLWFTLKFRFEQIKCLSCLDSALALDGIGSLIENELKLLIEKCLADYAEKEQEKNENSPWFTSYVRNASKNDQKCQ